MPGKLWGEVIQTLRRRGHARRESGAFLLGRVVGDRREVSGFVPYDDLDPHCLDTGIVSFDGACYSKLWDICETRGCQVVGDVHTHPENAFFSGADRAHPMISQEGHVAVVLPGFAMKDFDLGTVGVYVYRGSHQWESFEPGAAGQALYVGWLA